MSAEGNIETLPHVTYQVEPLSDTLYMEMKPLLFQEWEEVGYRKDVLKLSIDLVGMDALARAGRLAIFTLRVDDRLYGYVVFTIMQHPKYSTTLWASMLGWYVSPEARKPTISKRHLHFAMQWLKEYGIQFVQGACRIEHPTAGKLLESEGFKPYELGYLKVLQDVN